MSDIIERLTKTVGRPRTTTPPPEELIELGKDMVRWATEKTSELRFHLNQWYCLKLGISHADFELMKDKPEFHPYYEQARIAISKRYVDSSIAPPIAQRFIRHYFPEVKGDEDDTLRLKAELAKKEKELDAATDLLKMRECLAELRKDYQGVSGDSRSKLENSEPILDQGCLREPCEVQTQLGTARDPQ